MKQAIIIGATSGIGEALARKLVAEGWRVAVTGRREERLSALASELGGISQPMDLSDPDTARLGLETLWHEMGNVDLVIISAGTGYPNLACDWEPERETLAVNVSGFAAVAQTAMRLFLEQGHGQLAGISSIARFRGSGEGAAYAASKAVRIRVSGRLTRLGPQAQRHCDRHRTMPRFCGYRHDEGRQAVLGGHARKSR